LGRLPIRVRLAVAFALATAVVLAATGAFVYLRLGSSLDETIDDRLETRLAEAVPLAARGERDLGANSDESLARVVEPRDFPQVEAGRSLRLERATFPGLEGRARLLATAVDTPQGRRVVVVGESLEERDDALDGLLVQLLAIGPVALVLVSLLGYGLTSAALRPVEAMRAEAAEISAAEPDRRLPVPSARDEIARLAATLNGMLDRLQAALTRERSFIADASHELRTPLALLKAELELALRRPRSNEELEQALRSAAAETDRLTRLSEDLLVLARSDQGRLPLRRGSVAASDLVSTVATRFAPLAEANGRKIQVDAPDALRLTADLPRLEQALGNLVANALDHGAGSIRLRAASGDGTVELHVLDEGPGFPAGFLPHAFERFSRADEARSGGGAGLGLAIADVIARAHGGSVQVDNHAGGVDVWLSIPAAFEAP
jgi:two-component system OmpR family sensor kinase